MSREFVKINKFKRAVQSIGDHTSRGANPDQPPQQQPQPPQAAPPPNPSGGGHSNDEAATAAEVAERRSRAQKARQRWKILCLVKASDTVADETARKERVQEKVDDWMRTMVHKLTIDDTLKSSSAGGGDGAATPVKTTGHLISPQDMINADTSKLISKVPTVTIDDVKKREDKIHQEAESERMAARAEAERERERQLVLEGKIKLKREHLKDPVLKLHYDMIKLRKRALREAGPQSPRPTPAARRKKLSGGGQPQQQLDKKVSTTSSVRAGAYKPGVKLKWSTAMSRITANAIMEKKNKNGTIDDEYDSDLSDGGGKNTRTKKRKSVRKTAEAHRMTALDEAEKDTVVARFVYDEQNDLLKSTLSSTDSMESDKDNVNGDVTSRPPAKVKIKRINPVYQAFDDVEGVDDLYRIAEFCVQPSYLYQHL